MARHVVTPSQSRDTGPFGVCSCFGKEVGSADEGRGEKFGMCGGRYPYTVGAILWRDGDVGSVRAWEVKDALAA